MAMEEPAEAYRVIRGELEGYSQELASRPTLVVATKVEDEESRAKAVEFFAELELKPVIISAVTGDGLDSMLKTLQRLASEEEEG